MRYEPTSEERATLDRIARVVSERIRAVGAEPIVGGSYAKDTWLPGSRDIDIFARFDAKTESELEAHMSALFEAFPEAESIRGSRTYLRFAIENVTVEIIPIRPLGPDANTMDHSPDHIMYVRDHLSNTHDVRELKALLKANRIYGAESHVRGFSGYVCELLIIAHDSLGSLARAATEWKSPVRVSFHDDPKAFEDVLIIEDPTAPERNAAAAVDAPSLERFIDLMRRIASGEDHETLMRPEELEAPYVRIRMHASHEKKDVGFAQLRVIHERLERELMPFGVRGSQWVVDDEMWESRFALGRYELEKETTRTGPPLRLERAVASFKKHHPRSYEHEGHIVAPIEREETSWEHVAQRVCTHPNVASYETEEIR